MDLLSFLSGAITMGFLTAGLFFLRFWKRTADALFLRFAAAFWLLAFTQALLTLSGVTDDWRGYLFLFRLAAFLLIIVAILRKNMTAPGGRG